MISKDEADFLSSVLSEVGHRDPISDIEFLQSDIDEFYSRVDDGRSGQDFNPKRFFSNSGYSVCLNCGSKVPACSCVETEDEQVYLLDTKYIVEEWCDQVESIQLYEDLYVEDEGPPLWTVKAVSREFGVITFLVASRGDRLIDVNPDIFEKEFVISLIESIEVVKQDHYYMWYELFTEESHTILHSVIRDTVELLSDGVYDKDSEVTRESINAIDNNLRKYIEEAGFSRVDAQREVGGVGQILDFSKIDFAAKNEESGENGVILICECDKSAKDVHLHYVKEGEVQPVSGSETAEKAANRMRDKIDDFETLRQNTHNLGNRTRAFFLAAGVVSIGPIVTAALGWLDLAAADVTGYPYYPRALVSIVLLAFFVILILPMVKMSLFSWDIRGLQSRTRDRLSSWLTLP